jgi:RNA polymerase sigma-70 factor (ECF subfamily)
MVDDSNAMADIRSVGDRELIDHIRALRRYAVALVGCPVDADDLVQEALKRALLYVDSARQIDDLRAYLFRILHNARNDMLKQRLRAGTPVPVDEAGLVSGAVSQMERIACHQVVGAMDRLAEDHRQLLLLVGIEEMSYREAADALGLPIGTVMSRLNRARAALRGVLDMDSALGPGGGS